MNPERFKILVAGLKRINLEAVYNKAIKEVEPTILAQQKEQLYSGVADKGDDLWPPYAERTIADKKQKGQPTDRVTLKDKGNFYRRMKVKYAKDHFEIRSSDRKSPALVDKYHGTQGGDVFGLAEESKRVIAQDILPLMQDEMRDKISR